MEWPSPGTARRPRGPRSRPVGAKRVSRGAEGKIYKYDVTGGRYDEAEYHATGSGGTHARASMKKRHREDMDEGAAIHTALEALYDAAEEDVGTAGPGC